MVDKETLSQQFQIVIDHLRIGLSEDDSAVLAGFSKDEYSRYIEGSPTFKTQVNKAIIEYKARLMKPITAAIDSSEGDSKLAVTMLERKFPEEFSTRRRNNTDPTDLLTQAIRDIQAGGSSPLIGKKQVDSILNKEE